MFIVLNFQIDAETVQEFGTDITGGKILRTEYVDIIRHFFIDDRHVAGTGQIGTGRTWHPPSRLLEIVAKLAQSWITEERDIYPMPKGQPPSSIDYTDSFKGRHSHLFIFSDAGIIHENICLFRTGWSIHTLSTCFQMYETGQLGSVGAGQDPHSNRTQYGPMEGIVEWRD